VCVCVCDGQLEADRNPEEVQRRTEAAAKVRLSLQWPVRESLCVMCVNIFARVCACACVCVCVCVITRSRLIATRRKRAAKPRLLPRCHRTRCLQCLVHSPLCVIFVNMLVRVCVRVCDDQIEADRRAEEARRQAEAAAKVRLS
jgi:hypothetical protein